MNTDKNPGFVSTTGNGIGMIKVEDEETGNETYAEAEKERAILPKEEREGVTEEGMEEGYDGDRTEDDDDNDGERDSAVEPEDLSLVDYSLYNSAALQDASTGAASERTYMTGAMTPHMQPMGKLNCDICGLSCVSINVLLVHKRSHTGERPFHCSQCGASFTQKGNLLRHIKLHSGEKPFKCPMCSYACRRRDALSGHLRTHSVEKPFKCNLCSRSYKQRSSLEEHRERCHVYIHSKAPAEKADDSHLSRTQMGTERALLLDRLATNVAKRKSSMPQKFTGDNGVCLDLSLNRNPVQQQDPPLGSPGPEVHSQQPLMRSGPDSDPAHSQRPYPVLLNRNDISPIGLTNGLKMIMPLPGLPHTPQQPLGVDAFYTDSSHGSPIMYSLGHLLGGLNHQNGIPHSQPIPLSPLEALQVARADREAGGMHGALYSCSHCKVIFLDYVMFTIHMGCHGFRDPLECNVCGHRSRDRYEFSSHIVRGEHRVEMK
ncbi:zinc finger protein Aiolos-like isoform X1 [Phyllopteryx taeniolatus]|uniref:zinc finger protein Aiolos-like isoform X1 n=1 Tax=Phyllopteryx taeniolatus TaxID=161469 RepID=UPI002AD4A416|nr:zinc finger protein Aiolos-like isoform X1 [Phyllopteryx taeniolatus]XP_061628192.1 zinc finger protein Aiolos-like isoform X1 [Phyllopteryx taeniolatus]XP_061628193.1 zinc finger protein Aiolos-like isoform X1 [Phyllopteryx taeniolatus]